MKVFFAIVIAALIIGGVLWVGSDNYYRLTYDEPKEEVYIDPNTVPIPEPTTIVDKNDYQECQIIGALLYLQGKEKWTAEYTDEYCSVYLNGSK